MQYKLISDASSVPITIDEIKQHLFIYDDTEDNYLASILLAAQVTVAQFLGEYISATEVRVDLPTWGSVMLPHRHVNSVTSVKYYDTDDVLQTVASSNYVVENGSDGVYVNLKSSFTLPELSDNYNSPIQIAYEAGMTVVPDSVLQAIKIVCAEMYQSRTETTNTNVQKFPLAAERLLQAVRRW